MTGIPQTWRSCVEMYCVASCTISAVSGACNSTPLASVMLKYRSAGVTPQKKTGQRTAVDPWQHQWHRQVFQSSDWNFGEDSAEEMIQEKLQTYAKLSRCAHRHSGTRPCCALLTNSDHNHPQPTIQMRTKTPVVLGIREAGQAAIVSVLFHDVVRFKTDLQRAQRLARRLRTGRRQRQSRLASLPIAPDDAG